MWFIKLNNIAMFFKMLGPNLIMVNKMLSEMTFFLVIIFIYTLAYAIPTIGFFLLIFVYNYDVPK